jgi:hypothetical protein
MGVPDFLVNDSHLVTGQYAAVRRTVTVPHLLINCWNIESRHIDGSLSGCPATKPHANLSFPLTH